jgi:uncharacterized SAM-binding protein YcdF (DUF218 family)
MTFIYLLLNPIFQVLLLMAVGLLLLNRGKRTGRIFLLAGFIYFFLVSSSPVPVYLMGSLERSHPVFDVDSGIHKANILVLGAGFVDDPALVDLSQLSQTELARLAEGVRIYHQIPEATLITSASSKGPRSQAEVVANAAISLGVSPADTAWMVTPTSTQTEALAYARRFAESTTLILVTDAAHMSRALFWFRQQGLKPIPAPTNFRVKESPYDSPFPFTPGVEKIIMMDMWIHEKVGMLWAKLKS